MTSTLRVNTQIDLTNAPLPNGLSTPSILITEVPHSGDILQGPTDTYATTGYHMQYKDGRIEEDLFIG